MLVHLVVIDVELFPTNIIKELGICYGTYSRSFTFRPPYSLVECTKPDKRQIKWLSNNLHFLTWDSGEYEYNEMQTIIATLKPTMALYYCKGAEKAALLTSLFGHTVFNLENLNCPNACEIDACFGEECGSHTSDMHKQSLHCAQRKAVRFSNWLKNNL